MHYTTAFVLQSIARHGLTKQAKNVARILVARGNPDPELRVIASPGSTRSLDVGDGAVAHADAELPSAELHDPMHDMESAAAKLDDRWWWDTNMCHGRSSNEGVPGDECFVTDEYQAFSNLNLKQLRARQRI